MAFNDKKIGRINHMLIIFLVIVLTDLANGPNRPIWCGVIIAHSIQ